MVELSKDPIIRPALTIKLLELPASTSAVSTVISLPSKAPR